MEANGDYQKLIKAMLGQKYYEQAKTAIENNEEIDDSVFNYADFNDDGKVDEKDKDMFEEYIENYEELFGKIDIDNSNLEELAQQTEENNGEENTEGEENQNNEKLNELKEQALIAKTKMDEAKTKYDNAVQKQESAKKKQENAESKAINMQARYESEKQRYSEVLRKKMKADNNTKGDSKNSYNEQLSESKKSRDAAGRNAGLATSQYGVASASKAYYDSEVTNKKVELTKYTQEYTNLSNEFSTMYDGLSEDDKANYGANPFIEDNQ